MCRRKNLIFITFFYTNRKSIDFVKNFEFLIDLHALGCPEHDLTFL